jgi:hypothetical protein
MDSKTSFATSFDQNNFFYSLCYNKRSNYIKIYKKQFGTKSICIEKEIDLKKTDLNGEKGE